MPDIPFDPHGILLRRTAVALGYDDNWLQRQVRAGALVKIRHGAYADPGSWSGLSPAGRHLAISRAVLQVYDDRVALSHASAHVARGGPDHGLDLRTVNLTNLYGRGDRTQAGITHHHGTVRVGDVSRYDGFWITAPARTAIETAASARRLPAICVLDWTVHEGLATPDQLRAYAEVHLREWPGTVDLPQAVSRCDGRSESVGETITRTVLMDAGILVQPQWEVFHPSGKLAGRVDLLLPELGIMVEFDGKQKYGRLLKPGQTIADVIRAERARELLLEELTGLRMVRFIWSDLDRPSLMVGRVLEVAAQRRAG